MDLYFENYADLKAAVDALAKERWVKRVTHANGAERIWFMNGEGIRFHVSKDRRCRCRCPQGCC